MGNEGIKAMLRDYVRDSGLPGQAVHTLSCAVARVGSGDCMREYLCVCELEVCCRSWIGGAACCGAAMVPRNAMILAALVE